MTDANWEFSIKSDSMSKLMESHSKVGIRADQSETRSAGCVIQSEDSILLFWRKFRIQLFQWENNFQSAKKRKSRPKTLVNGDMALIDRNRIIPNSRSGETEWRGGGGWRSFIFSELRCLITVA